MKQVVLPHQANPEASSHSPGLLLRCAPDKKKTAIPRACSKPPLTSPSKPNRRRASPLGSPLRPFDHSNDLLLLG
jgi:hypothetical protein